MLVKERLERGSWVPPWLRYQHVARYEWARQFCGGGRVLDAACGNGYGSRILSADGRVASLDISPQAVHEAQQSSGASLSLLLGDASMLPFGDGAFDLFVSFETIEHVRDDASYVREARRVVGHGGTFICSTPNRALVNAGNSITDRPFNPYHVREYTADELRQLLGRSFTTVEMMGQSAFAAAYVRVLRLVGSLWPRGAVRLHQLRKFATIPFESRRRHEPQAGQAQPEVLLAICR